MFTTQILPSKLMFVVKVKKSKEVRIVTKIHKYLESLNF